MFRKLVVEKKNIISYIFTLLVSFGVTLIGATPFGYAMLGGLIEDKIPILIPSVIVCLIAKIMYGNVSLLRMVFATLLYAIFKAVLNKRKEESKCKTAAVFVMSYVLSSLILVLLKLDDFEMMTAYIFEAFLSAGFLFVFANAIKTLFDLNKIERLKNEDIISIALLLILCFTFFNNFELSVWGITIFSTATIVFLMIACYKKNILTSIVYSLVIAFIYFLIIGNCTLQFILLYMMVGVVSALLSKASQVGYLIGLTIAFIYTIFLAPTQSQLYNQLGYNEAVVNDYNQFATQSDNNKNPIADETNPDYIIEKEVAQLVNSPVSIVFKEMLIGFVVLLLLPQGFYEKYDKLTKSKKSVDLFKHLRSLYNPKVLLLNAGNPENEKKDNTPSETKSVSKSSKKKSTTKKKNKKK